MIGIVSLRLIEVGGWRQRRIRGEGLRIMGRTRHEGRRDKDECKNVRWTRDEGGGREEGWLQ